MRAYALVLAGLLTASGLPQDSPPTPQGTLFQLAGPDGKSFPWQEAALKELHPGTLPNEATFRGTVNGIEVVAPPGYVFGLPGPYCLAYVNPKHGDAIRVMTAEHRLQTVLESASARGVEVEVGYIEKGSEKWLTRVRILDRPPAK